MKSAFIIFFFSLSKFFASQISLDSIIIDFQVVHLSDDNIVFLMETNDGNMHIQRLDREGSSLNSTSQTFPPGDYSSVRMASCALKNDGLVLIWGVLASSVNNLMYMVLDNRLNVIQGQTIYASPSSYNPVNSVVPDQDGGFEIIYFKPVGYNVNRLFFMKLNSTGNIFQQELQINNNTQNFNTPTAVTLNNSNIFVHFYGDLDGEVMIINNTGSLVNPPTALYPGSTGTAYQENVCMMNNGNVFVVSCFSSGGLYYGNYAIFDRNGAIVLAKQQITNVGSSGSFQPFCQCLSNGNCVMIWSVVNGTSFDVAMAAVNSTGSKISQKIAMRNMAKDIYGTASFSDDSILIAALTSTPGSINISYFNSDLDPIYVNETCKPPLNVITPDKKGCFSAIVNCSTYNNDGTCNSCVNSTALALSVNNKTCVPRITGCKLYNDNSTCHTCNNTTILTEGLVNCANPIVNCLIYWDNKTCKNCLNLFALSIDKRECINASSISGCLTYNSDGTCNTCENPTILSLGKLACVNSFRNCSTYNDDGTCNTCENSTILSLGKLACVNPFRNCSTYNDNGTCNTCENTTILSLGKLACVKPFRNCSTYNSDGTCNTCENSTILSLGKLACVNPFRNCSTYNDDGTCNNCVNSSIPSIGKLACVSPLLDCLTYNENGTCNTCVNSKILSIGKWVCVNPIINCVAINDNGTCSECKADKILTDASWNCTTKVENCSSYLDLTGVCQKCKDPYVLSFGNDSCVKPIPDCINQSSNGICFNCKKTKQ